MLPYPVVIVDDPNDRAFLINGQSQFLVWAIGPRATVRDLAFFHTEYPRNGGNYVVIGVSLSEPHHMGSIVKSVFLVAFNSHPLHGG